MQFIKNGPDVPEQLLQAHEDGKVVFFCGAGISRPARLPEFKGLVQEIYRQLGEVPNSIEIAALDRNQYDTTIGLLENRIVDGRSEVRRALAKVLAPDLSLPGATQTHEALLTLAKSRTNRLRLITTNFDCLFEEAKNRLRINSGSFAAPLLPVPKKRWDGIVYLHGRLPTAPTQTDLDNLVISSGDFGLAYLTERWAARFASELFRNHTVCFVGYSINDPVMRYMMDALAADRLLGETPIEVFAFGNHARGREDDEAAEWAAKNVTPILYRNHKHHALLHQTLHAWASTYRDGVRGKESIVTRYAALKPMGSTRQDNFVGRVLWALCDESGLPAKVLADHNPLPSIDWLTAFADERFGHSDLTRFDVHTDGAEDKKLAYSLIARPAPYTKSPWMRLVHRTNQSFTQWDDVMRHIARWLSRHIDNPQLLVWVAGKGGCLDENFRFFLEGELEKNPPSPAMQSLWRIVLSKRLGGGPLHYSLYQWAQRFSQNGLTTFLRIQLRELLSPRIQIRAPYRPFDTNEGDEDVDATVRRPDQLVDWELVLTASHVHSVFHELRKNFKWNLALPALLNDATELLREAMDLKRELQAADDRCDRSHWHHPSISEHPQNQRFRDWTALIDFARDAWLTTADSNAPRAIRETQRWLDLPYPVFKRLAFFAFSIRRDLFPAGTVLDFLLSEDGWWLWSGETHRESMRLIATLAPELRGDSSDRLQKAIIAGPPAEMLSDDVDAELLRRRVDHMVWIRLTAIQNAGGSLGQNAASLLRSLSETYPEWRPADERDEFLVWIGRGGSWHMQSATPQTIREIIEWLQQPNDGDDFYSDDDWRERCRKDFRRTSAALLHLAQRGVWVTHRWRQALQAWSDAELAARSWRCIAMPLSRAPDEVIEKLGHAIAWWLKTVAKCVGDMPNQFFSLIRRILYIHRGHSIEDDSDVINRALNSSIGMATEAMLDFWYFGGLEDGQGLQGEFAELFTLICNRSITAYRHGRVLLCVNAVTFFRVDQNWTEKFLLPQFDWKEGQQSAILAWSGYLWSPRLYKPLLESFKIQFLETAKYYDALADSGDQYAALLTFVALEDEKTFTKSQLRSATGKLPEAGLVRALQTLIDGLRGAADRRADYWKNRIEPYLKNVWPREHEKRVPPISEKFAELIVTADDTFPVALEALRGWLLPIEHSGYVLHHLSESSLCATYPSEAVAFLDLIIPSEAPWVADELLQCLRAIRAAWPASTSDQRFSRLETIIRQTGKIL